MPSAPMRLLLSMLVAALTLFVASGPAAAQIGLPGGGLPGRLPQTPGLPDLPSRLPDAGTVEGLARQGLAQGLEAPSRLSGLIRRSGGALEADPRGWPVVRNEVVAIDLTPEARRLALAAGFTVAREERLAALDMSATVLVPPRGLSLSRALERLRELDPGGGYEFNHVHAPAGALDDAGPPPPASSPPPVAPQGEGGRMGLIDTGVDARHPAVAGARIIQRGFSGEARAAPHGTAVASLMIGRSGAFSGAAPGGELYAADVYGGARAGGSSTGLVQALAWMAENRVPVVNVSLVGPRNAVVEAAVRRATARGMLIVAAVGNDGPAAPPLYPAAYPDVVGVTAVNGRGRVLPEAGRGPQVDFAAPGADMAAAGPGQGYVSVRGSSFASPLVAGLLARRLHRPDRGDAEAAIAAVARAADDAGARGPDPVYGRGLVAADRRVEPRSVGARGQLTR
ncbi:S8 family serine peptidase [Brevundimonas sp.]|uniref:S8 family serine peptidase n=1 Tax=Brevundimonas sp. TaxID=1871086 RepID=UPI002737C67A|nr:S8 family serine peptidase [Brevundimonas sp.]MDP3801398.1 S8 family serine peptidase [Brevundimonas sp.]